MYKISFIHRVTKFLVDVMFYGGIAACAALPFLFPRLPSWGIFFLHRTVPALIILMASGLCAVYILYQLKLMFKTLMGKEPFVHQNVNCFRKCGVASFVISLLFAARLVVGFTYGAVIVVMIFFMLGLFSLTMKDIFKQAVFYKEESDWTV